MDYINFHTSVIDSAEFMTASGSQRGTWLCLYRYCAGQENGGRIVGARAWSDRYWLQVCGVSLREVNSNCLLWCWQDDTLVVSFYNIETERKVERLRSQAAAGAHARWGRKRLAEGMPQGMPEGIPEGTPQGMPEGDAKRNGKEGKEKEGIPAAAASVATGTKSTRKVGTSTPSEHVEPTRSRMTAIAALKGRTENSPWSAKEFEAFRGARLDTCSDDDFAAQVGTMQRYYRASIPREIDYRRRELLTLLTHWHGELDKARVHNRDNNDGYTVV